MENPERQALEGEQDSHTTPPSSEVDISMLPAEELVKHFDGQIREVHESAEGEAQKLKEEIALLNCLSRLESENIRIFLHRYVAYHNEGNAVFTGIPETIGSLINMIERNDVVLSDEILINIINMYVSALDHTHDQEHLERACKYLCITDVEISAEFINIFHNQISGIPIRIDAYPMFTGSYDRQVGGSHQGDLQDYQLLMRMFGKHGDRLYDGITKRKISPYYLPYSRSVILDTTVGIVHRQEELYRDDRVGRDEIGLFVLPHPDLVGQAGATIDGIMTQAFGHLDNYVRKQKIHDAILRFNMWTEEDARRLPPGTMVYVPGEGVDPEVTKDRYHYLHQVRDTQIIPAHIEASEEVETIFTLPYDIGYTLPQTGNKWSLTDSQLQRYVELRDGDVQRRLQHADEEDEVEPLGDHISVLFPEGIVGRSAANRGNTIEAMRGRGPHKVVWDEKVGAYIFEGLPFLGPTPLPEGTEILDYEAGVPTIRERVDIEISYPQLYAPINGFATRFNAEHGEHRWNYGIMTGYTDKEYGKDMGHDGIDIGLPDQTPIFCAHSEAEVIAIDEYPDTYGLFVLLYDKTNGTITRYSHLSNVDPDIQMGSTVTHTSRIGLSGQTGKGGLHLDFEVYRYADDQYINEAVEGVKGYEERERILREQFESLDPLCCVQHVREYSRIDEFDVYTEPPSWYQESTEELPRFPTRDYEVEPGDSWAKIAQRSDVWLTHQAVRHFEHGNPFERSGGGVLRAGTMIELPIIPKLELSNTQERERVIQVLQADIDRVTAPHLKKLPQSHDHVTAEKIIEAAEKYGVSWTYVAAFARNDSNYGTLGYGARTNNPGNIGIYGDGSNEVEFDTMQDGLNAVAKEVGERIRSYQVFRGNGSVPSAFELAWGIINQPGNYEDQSFSEPYCEGVHAGAAVTIEKIERQLWRNYERTED